MRSIRALCLSVPMAAGLLIVHGVLAAAAPTAAPPPKVEEIAITTSSPEARALFIRGRDLLANGHAPEARKAIDDAIAKDPSFVMAHLYRSMLATETAQSVAALKQANELLAKVQVSDGEKQWVAYQGLAMQALQNKRLEHLQKMMQTYPKDRWLQYEMGTLQIWLSQNEQAVETLTRLTRQFPDFAPGYSALGGAQTNLRHFAEAEVALKKYTELAPKEVAAWDSLSWLLVKQGKFDEAIASFDKALAIDPTFCSSLLGQGTSKVLKGKNGDGRALFAKANAVAQDDWCRSSALYSSMLSYLLEGKTDPAVKEYQKLIAFYEKKKDPAAVSGFSSDLGTLLAQAARNKEAVKQFDKSAAQIDQAPLPDESKAASKGWLLHAQALMFIKSGDLTSARQKADDFKLFVEKYGSPSRQQATHQLAGMIALKEKKYDEAIAELDQADQRSCLVLMSLGEAYQAKGDKDKARGYFAQVVDFNELNLEFGLTRAAAKSKLAALK